PARELLRPAGHHGHPDAGVDGAQFPADAGGGERRRERALRRDGRRDALRRDRGRAVPGAGRRGHGPDRGRDRADAGVRGGTEVRHPDPDPAAHRRDADGARHRRGHGGGRPAARRARHRELHPDRVHDAGGLQLPAAGRAHRRQRPADDRAPARPGLGRAPRALHEPGELRIDAGLRPGVPAGDRTGAARPPGGRDRRRAVPRARHHEHAPGGGALRLRFLGTGTSFGIPVIGCHCATCTSSDPRDRRTRHAALIEHENGRRILIDAPPELRLQLVEAAVGSVDAIWFTHYHADHTHGVDDLRAITARRDEPLVAYAGDECADVLLERFAYIFDPDYRPIEGTTKPDLRIQRLVDGEPVDVAGITMLPIAVPPGDTESFGFRIGDLGYVTDAKTLPGSALEALA